MVGETVSDVSELALLNVLLDRVERLFLGDFHLGVGPSGNLDNHCRLTQCQYLILEKKKEKEKRRTVEDSLGLVGKERNVASDSVSTCRTLLAQRIGRKGKGKMERTGREKRPCPPARCRHGALWKRYQYTVLNYFLAASVPSWTMSKGELE